MFALILSVVFFRTAILTNQDHSFQIEMKLILDFGKTDLAFAWKNLFGRLTLLYLRLHRYFGDFLTCW